MTFDEMFAQAKALLENASAKDTDTAVSVQFDVSGDGCGAFYAVVSADSDKLTIEPFDYKDHDVLVSADSAALLDALRTAETAALELAGEWERSWHSAAFWILCPSRRRRLLPRQRLRLRRKPLQSRLQKGRSTEDSCNCKKDGTGKVCCKKAGGCNRKEGNRQG